VQRTKGKASAVECPIGWRPRYRDICWDGLETFTREEFNALMNIDRELWKQEMLGHEELFEKLYDRLPKEFFFMRELLLSALWRSPENYNLAPERHD
jgi:phosphoenolpyruvate carboxykinase (GTP)